MRNILSDCMNRVLTKAGFKKKSDTWYSERDETILVVNLQKSQWGEQFYVNLALWVKELGVTSIPPKEHLCHIRTRLTSLTDDSVEVALNVEDTQLEDAERRKVFERSLKDIAIPFLEHCSTLQGLKAEYQQGSLEHAMVHREVKNLMGYKSTDPV